MKTILKSKEIVQQIKAQKAANAELQEIHKKLVEYDKKREKMQFKIQRIKDRGVKLLDKLLKDRVVLDPLEYTGAMNPITEDTFELEIHNVYNDNFGSEDAIKERLLKDRSEKKGLWADPLMFTGHKDK
jgi:hypothetical protein